MHAPSVQMPPLGHARSHAPQCAGSLLVSAQASPHSSVSSGHAHCPALQVAASGQARSHEPQCAASVANFAQSAPHTCRPLGHSHCPAEQAAASGHLVAQSPQCDALLCVSMHSAPHATPLLHVAGAPLPPLPAAEPPVVLAAPAVPPALARGPLNSPLEWPPPQWINPRIASRITRACRARRLRFHGKPPETRRSLADREADLEAEGKGDRISLEVSSGRRAAARAAALRRQSVATIDARRWSPVNQVKRGVGYFCLADVFSQGPCNRSLDAERWTAASSARRSDELCSML